jgi:predicted nucleotidyltransferase
MHWRQPGDWPSVLGQHDLPTLADLGDQGRQPLSRFPDACGSHAMDCATSSTIEQVCSGPLSHRATLIPMATRPEPGYMVSATLQDALVAVPPALHTLLSAYRRRLEEQYGPRLVKLTLFGSYARGEAHADSDVDVAVVLDCIEGMPDRILPMEIAGELTIEHALVITPIVMSKDEMAFLRQREDLLAENLDREGIPI